MYIHIFSKTCDYLVIFVMFEIFYIYVIALITQCDIFVIDHNFNLKSKKVHENIKFRSTYLGIFLLYKWSREFNSSVNIPESCDFDHNVSH